MAETTPDHAPTKNGLSAGRETERSRGLLGPLIKHGLFVVVLIVSFACSQWGIRDESPTEDEWAHLTRGIAFWNHGDTRMSFAHPPLANAVATAGLALEHELPDLTQSGAWEKGMDPGHVALTQLKQDYARYRNLLMDARESMSLFLILGLIYTYLLFLDLFGWRTAIVAATFVGWNPTIIAQVRYLTTDFPAAVTIFIAIGEFVVHATGSSRWRRWFTFPLALSVAFATKHTGAVLIVICVAMSIILLVAGLGLYRKMSFPRRVGHWCAHWFVSAVSVLMVSNASYLWQDTFLRVDETLQKPEPQYWISSPFKQKLLEKKTPLPDLPPSLRIPLPYTHVFGLACVGAQNERGYPMATFLGEKTPKGHVLYFPALLATKTPIQVWLGVLVGIGAAVWSRFRGNLAVYLFAGFTLLFIAILLRSNLNMGVRHALPGEWLLCVLGAIGIGAATSRFAPKRGPQAVLALLPATMLVTVIAAGPSYLGWYSAITGRERGHRISAVGDDWGQDRTALARLVEEQNLQPLYYHDQTRTRRIEAKFLGLKYRRLGCRTKLRPGAYAAIHLLPLQASGHKCWKWRKGLDPFAIINDHIYIYKIE